MMASASITTPARPTAVSGSPACTNVRACSAAPAGSRAGAGTGRRSRLPCLSARSGTSLLASESVIRLLIVDDHPIVGEAANGHEAVQMLTETSPDVVLLDLELPDTDGLTLLRQIRDIAPGVPVLIVTMHEDPARVRQAVQAGAAGYVLKGVDRAELLAS